MAVSSSVKQGLVTKIRSDLCRAEDLYARLVLRGMTEGDGGAAVRLLQVDRRDAAQFIFFEAAAKFESFARDAFLMEVRVKFGVQPQRAEYLMGHVERGLDAVMGWAVPAVLRDRARNLHGNRGFFARMHVILGNATIERLSQAHKVRNRIAHASGRAVTQYRGILGNLRVPAGSRKGLSPGRLLVEYPTGVPENDRWFYRFLSAYRELVTKFNRSVRV